VIGTEVAGHTVLGMEQLETLVRKDNVQIAILAIPKEHAHAVAMQLVSYGIVGFWNFATVDLKLPEHISVENVHLEESLMNLAYNISAKE
jgi:redox-sensing transcriptional repressor